MTKQVAKHEVTSHTVESLKVGSRLACHGYAGTVTKLLDWEPGMVEVRLASGVVCVSKSELVRFQNEWAA
jgi:hypothetical protein